jgi:hypothetical protein
MSNQHIPQPYPSEWSDILSCLVLGKCCLRESGMTSALIETQSSFYAHFKANKMPFMMPYYSDIFSTILFLRSSNLTFSLVFPKILCFNLKKETYFVCSHNYY